MEIPDGDLVRLARDGDPAAFRLLVERHLPATRSRAARLCPRADDVDDAVQDAFLQAFVALGRLRDPDRFAAWLGGIVVNVCRAQRRRARLTLLTDWPEKLHPASADGLPSAEDLDRADAVGRAVADLPPGQRQAVTVFYYADQPASQIPGSAGAAKASLHKARLRLRDYISTHRPDLVPVASRRTPMTAVRIAHAHPWPGRRPDGGMTVSHVIVVLADTVPAKDGRHRALPIRLSGRDGRFWRLLARPQDRPEDPGEENPEEPVEEMTGQLLQAAGITVTGVQLIELGPEVTAARIELGGARHVTTRLADGLAIAVISGAPLTVADTVLDRLAEPVTGEDLLGPFLNRVPAIFASRRRRRYEPRNLAFADGLNAWRLGGSFLRGVVGSHEQDYSCAVEGRRAIVSAAVPEPRGFAFFNQEIFADDYRGQTVVFHGELRSTDVAGHAGLVLHVSTEGQRIRQPLAPPAEPGYDPRRDPGNHFAAVSASHDWTWHEVTAQIPGDAAIISFGVFLAGPGQIEFRNAELEVEPSGRMA
jgi:RNA polymerase sigma-70 factor, ECF subfamily